MGTAYSTDEYSKCKEYSLVAQYNKAANNWDELSPKLSNLSDKQMSDITPIMIARKNYRGERNDGPPMYWTYNTDLVRLLKVTWDSERKKYDSTISVFNGYLHEKKYVGEQQRLAIHYKALLDYLENGVDGEIYTAVSTNLAKMRIPITKKTDE